jgi:transposase
LDFGLRYRHAADGPAPRVPAVVGFEVLPKRWTVERTFAWLSRFRCLARDFERYARTVAAFIRLAMIRIMLKRLVASPSS